MNYERKEKIEPALVIKNATFITSAAKREQFIQPTKPMIAVCGKSNVGKSSFINMMANQKKLAKFILIFIKNIRLLLQNLKNMVWHYLIQNNTKLPQKS